MTELSQTALEAMIAAAFAGFPGSGEHLPARLVRDLTNGSIRPDASPRTLARRYPAAKEGELEVAMKTAFRWLESIAGGLVIVSDGNSGEIIEQIAMPPVSGGYGGRSPVGLGLSAMTAMLDRRKRYRNARDFFLHVHIMPDGTYRKKQGKHVEQFGELLLTYRGWDKEAEDLDVPFPDGMPSLDREVCYRYSPQKGYVGFDGERWRCEW
ncbi:hypothetical protein GB927_034000 [Shinella sp. CPCC 100929]|uniref:Uncharacterized protein n=1 Tax=Shinella lacus TaxID=2654216 RepID=A0ABT1RIS1_9HYPH|nr:hypothetical protein [Shinella lacus]MCQ4635077.1 hypothetical protein [Shinella lacus]